MPDKGFVAGPARQPVDEGAHLGQHVYPEDDRHRLAGLGILRLVKRVLEAPGIVDGQRLEGLEPDGGLKAEQRIGDLLYAGGGNQAAFALRIRSSTFSRWGEEILDRAFRDDNSTGSWVPNAPITGLGIGPGIFFLCAHSERGRASTSMANFSPSA